MTWLRKLLLFGGVPAAGASASVPIVLKYQGNRNAVEGFNENEKVGEIDISGIEVNTEDKDEQIKILKRAGLFCGTTIEDGKECKVYSVGLRLKDGNNVEGGLKISSSSKGKLVLRRNKNTYSYGLRLTVEGGEISLEKEGKSPKKLERFESFGLEEQVKEGGEKELYLVKKETHQQGVMRALGIPSNCELPLDGNTRTCYLSHEHIKNVHFDGKKKEGAIVTGAQSISLNISKSVDSKLFNQGYRFAFSSPAEITIKEGDVIRSNASTEFTVKEWKDEDMVLVRAGSGEKEEEFFSKVGLKCDASSNVCTIQGGKLNVIKGDSTDNNKLTAGSKTGTGKGIIKLYREQANYVNGLKFFIEDGDIGIAGAPQNSRINRLSQLDGYEIVESKGHFYLKRKDSGLASIVKRLGLFDNPSSSVEKTSEPVFNTTIPTNQASKINFYVDNKGVTPVGTAAIDVLGYRTTDTDTYKYGYRFTLKATGGDITIGRTKLKNNITVDYKIKEEAGKLYLERTIDPEKLIEMVGLKCTKDGGEDSGTETCTFKEGKANIRHWGDRSIKGATAVTEGTGIGKVKLTRDQADFTDGFKFTVHEGDITFNGGTVEGEKIRMSEFEDYEIKLEKGTWFLNQKKNFMQQKYGALGIDQKCNNQFFGECEMEGMQAANNIKFKARKNSNVKGTFSSDAKVKIRLMRDSLLTTGIKVAMKVDGGTEERYISVVCNSDNKTLFKLTKTEEEFRIEKIGNDFYLTKITGELNETCTHA